MDPWTLVHFSAGLAMSLMDIPLRWAGLASAVYETAEQVFERRRWGQDLFKTSSPESLPNAAVDFGIFVAGPPGRRGLEQGGDGKPEIATTRRMRGGSERRSSGPETSGFLDPP